MNKSVYILFAAGLLTACQDHVQEMQEAVDAPISIGAELQAHADMAETRAAYKETVPDMQHPLASYVWASTTKNKFDHNVHDGTQAQGFVVEKHAYTTFYSSFSVLDIIDGDRGMRYPVNGSTFNEVYFIGLSPAVNGTQPTDSWKQNSAVDAYYTFNGSQDVMYAPQVSGHYTGDIPVLHFYHLLTHLRFVIKCEGDDLDAREEVSYGWGKLKNIKLIGQNRNTEKPKNIVTIDLSREASNLSQVEMRSTFSGTPDYLTIYKVGTVATPFPQDPGAADDSSRWYTLPTTAEGEEVASVLCAPVQATALNGTALTDEYTLELNTEHRSNVKVGIDLKTAPNSYYSGSTMGCEFVVTLNFRFGKVVATATAMYDWSANGGQTSFDITDN